MTITITKDLLTTNNPAYNESIIEYQTDLTGTITPYATIIINNDNNLSFRVYGINNKYFFNFKSIITSIINQNNFIDSIVPDLTTDVIYNDNTLSTSIDVAITINGYAGVTLNKTYSFTKNVEQLIGYNYKVSSQNDVKILLPSTNNIDYYLPYFEGYPTDFAIYGLSTGDEFYLKNTSTISVSPTYTTTSDDVQRYYLCDGASDATTTNNLTLSSNLNNVELWVNNTFKNNLKIKKNESKCGVYLKWFNDSGSYSYWLFDNINETIKTKTIDEISTGVDNLQNIKSTSQIIGKISDVTLSLSSTVNESEKDYFKSLLISPQVEMYVHNEPFVLTDEYSFVSVQLNDGTTTFKTKNNNYKINLQITLPSINTQIL